MSIPSVPAFITPRPARLVVTSMFIALCAAAAAQAQAQTTGAPLVEGPTIAITALDVEAAVQQYPLASRRSMLSRAEQVASIAEDLYIRRDLAEQARRAGLDKEPLIQALLRVITDRVLSEAQLYEIGKAAWPDTATGEERARQVYASEPQRFTTAVRTRARHILITAAADDTQRVKAREKAEKLLAEIKNGASFEQLAREQSADQATAGRGGDLGYFAAGTMVPAFEEAVAKLSKPGDVSGVVESQFGLHIIRLEDHQAAGPRPFDEVKGELIALERDRAHRDAQLKAADALRNAAKKNDEAIQAVVRQFAVP